MKRQLTLIPKHLAGGIVVIPTNDLDLTTETGVETCVRRMLAVPMHKSILLDFLVARQPGDPHLTEEHAELHRLQSLLNSRLRSKRFNYLGEALTARLFRNSIRNLPDILSIIKKDPPE